MNQLTFRSFVRELAKEGVDLNEAKEQLRETYQEEFKSDLEFEFMVERHWPRYCTVATVARDQYRDGKTTAEIAAYLKKPEREIELYIQKLKSKETQLLNNAHLSYADLAQAIQDGLSAKAIMERFNITPYYLKLFKKMMPDGHGNSKPQEDLEMIELYNEGWSYEEIGKRFGVSRQAVNRRIKDRVNPIIHRKNRKSIVDRPFMEVLNKHLDNIEAIKQDVKNGLGRQAIMKKHGIPQKVWYIIKCKIDRRHFYDRRVSIKEIMDLRDTGFTQKEISDKLGISVGLINIRLAEWQSQNEVPKVEPKKAMKKTHTWVTVDKSIGDLFNSIGSGEKEFFIKQAVDKHLDAVLSELKDLGLSGSKATSRIPLTILPEHMDRIRKMGVSIPMGQVIHVCLNREIKSRKDL
jgi:transcriptional regulator with XRE-family HTH domain